MSTHHPEQLCRIGLTIIAATLTLGCKPLANISTTAFILGDSDDIKKIEDHSNAEIPEAIRNASVLIATNLSSGGRKLCSGTLIGPADGQPHLRVLTNHHCFAQVDKHGDVQSLPLPEACTATSVYLGFVAGNLNAVTKADCQADSLQIDSVGDLAIFSLAGEVPSQFSALKISDLDNIPAERDAIVVHYPDVAANYASYGSPAVRLPLAAVTSANCKTAGDFPANEWELDRALPFSLQHSCDLEHGSSGSALVDRETQTILAVNWGGIKINYSSSSRITNVGTKADYVRAFIAGTATKMRQDRMQAGADAVAAKKNDERASARKSRLMAGCGIGGNSEGKQRGVPQIAVLSIIFCLPLFYAYLRRR